MNKFFYRSDRWKIYITTILVVNFIIRFVIFSKTNLFNFSDYQSYFGAIDFIHEKGHINLLGGNSLFAISYLGYFSKYLLGNLDYFFWFNCILGTLTTFLVSYLVIKVTGKPFAGLTTALILTIYTEFMVFSSVFYTPVIMLFLLSLFTLLIFFYFQSNNLIAGILYLVFIITVYLVTYLFKPELVFFPVFIAIMTFIIHRNKTLFRKSLGLTMVLIIGILLVKLSGIYDKKENEVIANDFIFFGHTDYGGDGGEGAFIYPKNRERYDEAWQDYRIKSNLNEPTVIDHNRFQITEIIKFITQHPFKWVKLQFTKFFRTFGVVPESNSFKVLYTGLLKGNLWLTSIVVVTPVASIIILFIVFFDFQSFKKLFYRSPVTGHRLPDNPETKTLHHNSTATLQKNFTALHLLSAETSAKVDGTLHPNSDRSGFLYIYLTLFIYYLIATVFFGQYQERYRLPVMVVFIIPVLAYFIANFNKMEFLNRTSLILKGVLIAGFMTIWIFQARNAISNKERFNNAMESIR